jgi:uncharacterized protein (TIGR02569 family)
VNGSAGPSGRVLDLFAVPDDVQPIPGGRGRSVVSGDLVLSPGRDAATAKWLNPPLARLAVDLDSKAGRSLRIAVPVPARDGSWVVDGWGASRYEPDSTHCRDLSVLVATGRLLNAHLDHAFPVRPPLESRRDRWAGAERLAFSGPQLLTAAVDPHDGRHDLLEEVAARLAAPATGQPVAAPDQLVHGDLAGNVLLDARGVPVVIDLSPYWRPVLWAEAVCVLDAVLWLGAESRALEEWTSGSRHEAMLRALAFRVLSDGPTCAVDRYATVLRTLPA